MRRAVSLLALLALSGCGAWPAGSYVDMAHESDAAILYQPVMDELLGAVEAGQTVRLLPAQQPDDMLTAVLAYDLRRHGIPTVDKDAAHEVQYIAAPLDDGEMLRVSIDGKRGGSQFFIRDASGRLQPAGPFMEFVP